MQLLHNAKTASHRGSRKTIEQCRRSYYWPFFAQNIHDWIKNCIVCAQVTPIDNKHIRPPLREITSKTSFPGDILQIDLVGPFTPSNGFTQILTAIDVFTKYLFATPIRRITAQSVTTVLTQLFLKHTYIPKIIMTDEGSQFTSSLMKDVTDLLDIELQHATVKHPQTIGLLERAHANLKKTLKIYENNQHTDWHKYVDYAVFAHNTNYNPITRSTPSDLFHGFAPNKALEVRFQVPHKKQPEFQTIQQIQDKLKELVYLQKDDIIQRYVKYKQYYDKQPQAYPLKIHTYCLLLNPKLDTQKQSMNKMLPKWLALYRVEKKMSHENYLIREKGTNHTQIVHRIRLRSYTPKHKMQDLENIDQKNFIPDPNFEDDYKQPAIIDKAQQKLLWHPTLSDTPETDDLPQPPTTYDTLFIRKPIINLKRLPNNTIGTTRRVIRPPQPATQPKLVVAPPNTNIQRVLQPTTSTAQRGPFQVKVPQPSTSANASKPATIKATTKRVIAAKLPKLFLQKAKHKMGEKTLKAAMLYCHSQTDPISGELPTIPENQDQIPTNNTTTIQNFPVIKWEDLPHPNWDEYEPDQQHLLMQLNTTQPTQSPSLAQNLFGTGVHYPSMNHYQRKTS